MFCRVWFVGGRWLLVFHWCGPFSLDYGWRLFAGCLQIGEERLGIEASFDLVAIGSGIIGRLSPVGSNGGAIGWRLIPSASVGWRLFSSGWIFGQTERKSSGTLRSFPLGCGEVQFAYWAGNQPSWVMNYWDDMDDMDVSLKTCRLSASTPIEINGSKLKVDCSRLPDHWTTLRNAVASVGPNRRLELNSINLQIGLIQLRSTVISLREAMTSSTTRHDSVWCWIRWNLDSLNELKALAFIGRCIWLNSRETSDKNVCKNGDLGNQQSTETEKAEHFNAIRWISSAFSVCISRVEPEKRTDWLVSVRLFVFHMHWAEINLRNWI